MYLSGFNAQETEKLRRVLNGGGATRFNEISDSVTHIIMGDIVSADLKALKCSGLRYGVSLLLVAQHPCAECYSPSTHFFWKICYELQVEVEMSLCRFISVFPLG